jgi:hypothetical protein
MEYSNENQCRFSSTENPNTHSFQNGFENLASSSSSKQESESDDEQNVSVEEEDSFSDGSVSDEEEEEPSVSDNESGVSGGSCEQFRLFEDGMVRLVEGERVYDIINRKFMSCFDSVGVQASIAGIHKNVFSSVVGQARVNSFQIYAEAIKKRCGGNANIKYGWFGSSKEEISKIVSHGFDHSDISHNNGLYGSGIYLSPDYSPLESACNSPVDKDGLRHLLLTRAILGKSEVVQIGSDQCHPSSEEFDSGMDNLQSPRKFIVWSTHMNTHTLPEYVVSFRAPPSLAGFVRTQKQPSLPTSPWMPFPVLISVLSKFLPPPTVALIRKHHEDHKEKKISRNELIQRLRQIAGDRVLIAVIKSFRAKQHKLPTGL